jgi:hypothetical protein
MRSFLAASAPSKRAPLLYKAAAAAGKLNQLFYRLLGMLYHWLQLTPTSPNLDLFDIVVNNVRFFTSSPRIN